MMKLEWMEVTMSPPTVSTKSYTGSCEEAHGDWQAAVVGVTVGAKDSVVGKLVGVSEGCGLGNCDGDVEGDGLGAKDGEGVETARERSSIETTTPQHSKKAVSNAPSFLAVLIALSIRATRELYCDKSDEELSPVVEATSIVKLTFAMKKGELAAKLVPSVFFVLTQLRSNEEKKTCRNNSILGRKKETKI